MWNRLWSRFAGLKPSCAVRNTCRKISLEPLETRFCLSVTAFTSSDAPVNLRSDTLDSVDVTFSDAIDFQPGGGSFTVDDVTIEGPAGSVTPTGITSLGGNDYCIGFDAQPGRGTYTVRVGPWINDLTGNPMDQDQDGTPGEPEDDVFTFSFDAYDADAVFTADQSILAGDTAYDGQDVAVIGGTLSLNGHHEFSSVQLIDGGVLTNYGTYADGLDVLANEVLVDAASRISVDGRGYGGLYRSPGQGPGAGGSSDKGAGGGGHGGGGGASFGAAGGAINDSLLTPVFPGSGGGSALTNTLSSVGGNGGGAIRLVVANQLTLDGQISANGVSGRGNAGGGAGGAIWVTTGTLTGSGIFQADGGFGVGEYSGGGGGGRIAVYYDNDAGFTGYTGSTAAGGLRQNSGGYGGVGTVGFIDTTVAGGHLHVYTTFATDRDQSLELGAVTVHDGATFTMPGASTLTLDDLTVESGGRITADGKGYGGTYKTSGQGPGAGGTSTNAGGGGGHGGAGGSSSGAAGGQINDSALAPVLLGSSGGAEGTYSAAGGSGGGAIRLIVSGQLTLDGTITANGVSGSGRAGGGAGGSIWVTTGTLAGSGVFQADGGDGTGEFSGGGGGGRIAVYYDHDAAFTGYSSSTASGGLRENSGGYGGAGTVGFIDTTVAGGHLHVYTTFATNHDESMQLGAVTVHDGATFTMPGASTLTTGDLSVESGGQITADGAGYGGRFTLSGQGPGAGGYNASYAGGGGYGGAGASAGGAAGGSVYGSQTMPVDLGSSGGASANFSSTGGNGGGAIRLIVNGDLTVDGSLTSRGNAGRGITAGGGSGGSIYITTGRLAGDGLICAAGGSGIGNGGGGGGGRIAAYYGTNDFTGQFCINGGAGYATGAAGTLYLEASNHPPTADDAEFTIAENSAVGTPVGTVPASDPDAGDTLSFAIVAGNTSDAFAIDNTGLITVNDKDAIDFETNPVFNLTVEVQDSFGQTDQAAVTVNLADLQATISIDDPSAVEGDSGTTPLEFTVSVSGDAVNVPFGVYFTTADETAAVTDNDYAAYSDWWIGEDLVFGGIGGLRGGVASLRDGAYTADLRAAILANAPGSTITAGGLTAEYLDTLDVLVLSSLSSDGFGIDPLTAAEQAAVRSFVEAGGNAFIFADNASFETSNESVLDPFGVDITGILTTTQPVTVTDPFETPIAIGPFGTVNKLDLYFSGYFDNLGPDAVSLGTMDANGQPGLLEIPPGALAPGSGRVVLVADSNLLDRDPAINTLVLNTMSIDAPTTSLSFSGSANESLPIPVTVNGDTKVELDETMLINLIGVTGTNDVTIAEIHGRGTIFNDDSATVSIGGASVEEGGPGDAHQLVFDVSLDNPVDVDVSIPYRTQNETAEDQMGDNDYTANYGTLIIPAGDTSGQIVVNVVGDDMAEADERIHIVARNLDAAGRDVELLGAANTTGANLTVNGDFEAGNVGFSSDYIYPQGYIGPYGYYKIVTDPYDAFPYNAHFGDHTSGSGNMFVAFGSILGAAWEQTVAVSPDTDYELVTYAASAHPENPARLRFSVNGEALGNLNLTQVTGRWDMFFATWNSGSATSATIRITDTRGGLFALDDIALAPLVPSAILPVGTIVNDDIPPVADVGGPYTIDEGDPLVLDASASIDPGGAPLTYLWDVDGDGDFDENVTGVSPTLSWAQLQALGIDDGPADFTVTLRVSNGIDSSDASTVLTVENAPPQFPPAGTISVTEFDPVTVPLSLTDPGNDTVSQWEIDWGDGARETHPGDTASAVHSYQQPGSFAVTAFATDEDGTWPSPGPATLANVTVANDPDAASEWCVTNTADSGTGSLRWAITNANANPGPDVVCFDIPVTDPGFVDVDSALPGGDADPDAFVIQPLTGLPALTDSSGGTTIDGWTQTEVTGETNPFGPEIVLDGSLLSGGPGVWIRSNGNRVFGLNVQQFAGAGIVVGGVDGNWIAGNYVGTDATGSEARANQREGVALAQGADNNVVGTNGDGIDDARERNVISANFGSNVAIKSADNVVAGNFIGVDATGSRIVDLDIGATTNGPVSTASSAVRIDGSSGNRIGTNGDGISDELERNVVAGGRWAGILLWSVHDTRVAGNLVGTDATGTVALGGGSISLGGGSGGGSTHNLIGTDGDGLSDELERNVISGYRVGQAVAISGSATQYNVVAGNYLGTDVTGTASLADAGEGIKIIDASKNVIGTNSDGTGDDHEGNLISGFPGAGIGLLGSENVVAGNVIGLDANGSPLGNGGGMYVGGSASFNVIGTDGDGVSDEWEPNIVAHSLGRIIYHGGAGVLVGDTAVGNSIRGNSIYANNELGIELRIGWGPGSGVTPNDPGDADTGGNNLQNFPVLLATESGAATRAIGSLDSTPGTTFALDFYANAATDPTGYGEGERYLGAAQVTTDAAGHVDFDLLVSGASSAGEYITATATGPDGTSEFSAGFYAVPNLPPVAADDTATAVASGPPVAIDVLANDFDLDPGDDLQVDSVLTTGTLGAVIISPDGKSVTYNPASVAAGTTDQFAYLLSDGHQLAGGFRLRVFDTDTVSWIGNRSLAEDVIAAGNQVGQANVDVVNLNNNPNGGSTGKFAGDGGVPGVPSDSDLFVIEATTYLQVDAPGQYTLGVNSDDGFGLTVTGASLESVVNGPGSTVGGELLAYDGNRGQGTPTLGVFDFPTAGIYPLRLVQWENRQHASVELFAAEGSHDTFDAQQFRLLGDTTLSGLQTGLPVTVTVTVIGPPEAGDDHFATDADTVLQVPSGPSPGLLSNDTDPDPGDTIAIDAFDATSAQGAAVEVSADGSFTYDPTVSDALRALPDGQTLDDTFTYTITDGTFFDTATVTVTVTGVNHPPTADAGGPYAIHEGGSLALDASGSTDPDGDPLSYSWDINGDNIFGDADGPQPVVSWDDLQALGVGVGTYDVTVHVADGGQLSDEAGTSLVIHNLPDLSGVVFDDLDNDGRFEPGDGETGIGGVTVTLTGTDDLGAVQRTAVTGADGAYAFADLRPGTYSLMEEQPGGFLDGSESAGTLGGSVDNAQDSNVIDQIMAQLDDADSGGYDFAEIRPSDIEGMVWEDFNNDGQVDFGEKAIDSVMIELSGTDDRGNPVSRSVVTDAEGVYMFIDLRPGDYAISETQPAGFDDGMDTLGTIAGVPTGDASANDRFSGVVLPQPKSMAINYNFGERPQPGSTVAVGQTAGGGFWQNRNGQKLIRLLNGGEEATQLGDWLATTLPNMYGSGAGANNLAGKTNAQVAEFYRNLFLRKKKEAEQLGLGGPVKLDAQVLAVALATYVTNQSLAGTTAADFGFLVTEHGVGVSTFNVGRAGEAFGVADNTEMTVLDILLATNDRTTGGVLYDQDGDGHADDRLETFLRTLANGVYSDINEQGEI